MTNLKAQTRPLTGPLPKGGPPGTTVVVEPTGSETLVIARLGAQTISCVFRERIRAAPGDVLKVAPIHDAVHLFGADEQRIASGEARLN